MNLNFLQLSASISKDVVTKAIKNQLQMQNFHLEDIDEQKPWGAYYRIDDAQLDKFLKIYFPGIDVKAFDSQTLSPKILLVEPGKKLSWQVHQRRAEFWRVVAGPVAVYLSNTDEQPAEPGIYQTGETVEMEQGVRHRLAGLSNWGIVAEIWIHTDPEQPSDEADIRRISDDFGR